MSLEPSRVKVWVGLDGTLTDGRGHLAPLQHRVLGDAAVGVDEDALVFVAHQHLRAGAVGQDDDGMGTDGALDLNTRTHTHTRFL